MIYINKSKFFLLAVSLTFALSLHFFFSQNVFASEQGLKIHSIEKVEFDFSEIDKAVNEFNLSNSTEAFYIMQEDFSDNGISPRGVSLKDLKVSTKILNKNSVLGSFVIKTKHPVTYVSADLSIQYRKNWLDPIWKNESGLQYRYPGGQGLTERNEYKFKTTKKGQYRTYIKGHLRTTGGNVYFRGFSSVVTF